MPAIMRLVHEEVDTVNKRGNYTLSIVGCGQTAVLLGLRFAEAGFKVVLADADQSATKRLSKGSILLGDKQAETKLKTYLKTEQLKATSDLKATVAKSDIILITVGARIDEKRSTDYTEIESVCRQVGAALQKGSLIGYCGVAGFGLFQDVVKKVLEDTSGLKVGEDFGLAYSPPQRAFGNETVLVAANDKTSLNSAVVIFDSIAKKGVVQVPNVKSAELATLFEAAKRDANAALTNEFAVLCENAEADFEEIRKLLEDLGCVEPLTASISEEENRNETYLLLDAAENLNARLRVPAATKQANEDIVRHAIGLTQEALRDSGKSLRRARVAVLGSAETGSAAALFVKKLRVRGAKVNRFGQSSVPNVESADDSSVKRTLNEAVETSDCIVLISDDEQFRRLNLKKLHAIMKSPASLVDLAGIAEPSKVRSEGFTYRGLGRGTWKK